MGTSRRHGRFFLVLLLFAFFSWIPARAIVVLEDTEIENAVRVLTKPLLQETGLPVGSIKFHILQDDSVNAFSTGKDIFLMTGLIDLLRSPDAFLGVVAHEMGHSVDQHIPKSIVQWKHNLYAGAAALLLAIPLSILALPAAQVASGIFGSILLATGTVAGANVAYTRENEAIADSYAMRLLRATGTDPFPMMQLMQKFSHFEDRDIPIYFLDHPISEKRLQFMRSFLKEHPYSFRATEDPKKTMYARVRIKLQAYLHPHKLLAKPGILTSSNRVDIYGVAIAYYVTGAYDKARKKLRPLLLGHGAQDPFYVELLANIEQAEGNTTKSARLYRRVLRKIPWAKSTRLDYVSLLLTAPKRKDWEKALVNLREVKNARENAYVWYLYLKAYGLLKQKVNIFMARARYNQLVGNCTVARRNAVTLLRLAKKNTPPWYVGRDVLDFCPSSPIPS